jgi:methylenetetrahydrofolate reductase (NADH)
MSTLAAALNSGNFMITTELNPPKGTNLTTVFEKVDVLKGRVHACNLTDSHTARMTMSPVAVAHLLLDRGVDPILQVTGRDRNRLALQADLLGAAALGIKNIVCMSGDDPQSGDHPQAKPVFDLDAITLLRAVSSLQKGYDLGGNKLNGAPSFYTGAVVNPGAPDLGKELQRMEEKVQAGAQFFQTQAVYDPGTFETFMNAAQKYNVVVLAGVLLLKSGTMARYLNDNVPGISVPDALIRELEEVQDRAAKSIEIGSRIIRQLKPMCQGVHLMALGWEARIPHLLQAAEIAPHGQI